jgi:hypothetical protein
MFNPDLLNYYVRARVYIPTVGAFMSRDPVRSALAASLYVYVMNNPVMLADPTGLQPPPSSIWIPESTPDQDYPPWFPDPFAASSRKGGCPTKSVYLNWQKGNEPLGPGFLAGKTEGTLWAMINPPDAECCTQGKVASIKIYYSTLTRPWRGISVNRPFDIEFGSLECDTTAEREFRSFNLQATMTSAGSNCLMVGPKLNVVTPVPAAPTKPDDCSNFSYEVQCLVECNKQAQSCPCPSGNCVVANGNVNIRFGSPGGGFLPESANVNWSVDFNNAKQCAMSPCTPHLTLEETGGMQRSRKRGD